MQNILLYLFITVPVPGGCNMEFAVETAPWLQLNVTGGMVTVNSQPARGSTSWGRRGSCNLPFLHYQGYHLYLPEQDFCRETYFNFVHKMLTVNRIKQNGRKVCELHIKFQTLKYLSDWFNCIVLYAVYILCICVRYQVHKIRR